MERLQNGFTLQIAPGTFPLSTDSMLLSDFVRLRKNASVLDLGSGCGTLGLLLCARDGGCAVTGVELDPAAHAAALENITANALNDRLFSICADLRSVSSLFSPGSFSVCVSNPPYFSGGPAGKAPANARREDCCRPVELFRAAGWSLRWGGDFYLVHRPERLAQLCACAAEAGLEPKRLRLVRHAPGRDVSLILLQCRKGAKPGLVWEEICLFAESGEPTDYYRKLYHLQEVSYGRNAVSGSHPNRQPG
ncbi:MAG: methyltransferase [Firmicutes bacterium]|nr:methyltransferase [Bacillota bacterium]